MMELCPWRHLSKERIEQFLTDPKNNEGAEDRRIVINYLRENFDKIRLLDVGCGTGHMYLAMKQQLKDFEYCGIDKTQKMVDFALARFPDVKFMQGDIHNLPFPNRSWPIVYVRHVLTHLPGYKRALPELARVCSDCLIICSLFPLAGSTRITIIGKPPSKTPPNSFSEHYLNIYVREPFLETLKDLGFNLAVDEKIDVGDYFKYFELLVFRRGGFG